MKVTRLKTAPNYEAEAGWKRSSLCDQPDVAIEHFVKPPGHASPRHEHPSAQVTVVLKGRMQLVAGDELQLLEEGDAAYIPGNVPHVVTNARDELSVGLDIFVPGRSFDFWLKRKPGQ